jgi:hypothetical protein
MNPDDSAREHAERLYHAFKATADGDGRSAYGFARIARIAGLDLEAAGEALRQLIPGRICPCAFGWKVTDLPSQQSERQPLAIGNE